MWIICLKDQDLFSLNNKTSKILECCLLQILLGALRVKKQLDEKQNLDQKSLEKKNGWNFKTIALLVVFTILISPWDMTIWLGPFQYQYILQYPMIL